MVVAARSRRHDFGYGVLALPLAFAGWPLYFHVPEFYAEHHNLFPVWLVVILLGTGVLDPFLAVMVQRISRDAGRRKQWLSILALPLIGGMWMVFHPDAAFGLGVAGWFVLSMLLCVTAHSVMMILYWSYGADIATESHARTQLTGWREAMGLIGVLLAVGLPVILVRLYPLGDAFHHYVMLFLPLLAVAMLLFRRLSPRVAYGSKQRYVPWRAARMPLRDPGMRVWLLSYGLSLLAMGVQAVLLRFFIRDRLAAEAYMAEFIALICISGVLAIPIWQYVSRKCGKKRAWMWALALSATGTGAAYFLSVGDVLAFAVVCLMTGGALGGVLALPPSILADMLHEGKEGDVADGAVKQDSNAALYFGWVSMVVKLVLASAIALSWLAPVHLSLLYALIPCGFTLAALGVCWRYVPNRQEG